MSAAPPPTVSVCLLNYRGERYLDGCLAALAKLDPAPSEYVAVDNASPDGSGDRLAAHPPTLAGRPFRFVRAPGNGGYAGGHNLGARSAAGAYLAFLNVTVQPEPGWLRVVPWLDAHPEVAFAMPATFRADGSERIESLGSLIRPSGQFTVVGSGRREAPAPPPRPFVAEVTSVLGAAFVARRAVFQELGGFDESMFMYFEESDLCWRGWLRGHRSVAWFDPSQPTRVRHAFHGTHPPGFDARRYFERNRTLSMARNLSGRHLPYVPLNVLRVASESARTPRFFARYLREVAHGLGDARRRRPALQGSRRLPDAAFLGRPVPPELDAYFPPEPTVGGLDKR